MLLPLYAVAGTLTGVIALVPVMMVRSFPTSVRFTGLSFSYNAAYAVFGGITPPLVAALAKLDRLAPAHYVAGVAGLGALLGLRLVLREQSAAVAGQTAGDPLIS